MAILRKTDLNYRGCTASHGANTTGQRASPSGSFSGNGLLQAWADDTALSGSDGSPDALVDVNVLVAHRTDAPGILVPTMVGGPDQCKSNMDFDLVLSGFPV
jgi:hypothetical protein